MKQSLNREHEVETMADEDKMIKKLEEHRDAIKLVVEVGALKGINVIPTEGNNPKGDFLYPVEKQNELIEAIDEYLGHRKYIKKDE